MGLPAVLEEITSFAREAQAAPSAEGAESLSTRLASKGQELEAHTRFLKQRADLLRQNLSQLVEDLSASPPLSDLQAVPDQVIDLLRLAEQDIKSTLAPSAKLLKEAKKHAFSMQTVAPGERARSIGVIDRYLTVLNESLEMLRDFRWKVMTLRADLESPGNAPVFDDPEKLLEYLKAHSG